MEQDMGWGQRSLVVAVGMSLAALQTPAFAGPAETERKLEELLGSIEAQSRRLEEQSRELARERAELDRQKKEFEALKRQLTSSAGATALPREAPGRAGEKSLASKPSPAAKAMASVPSPVQAPGRRAVGTSAAAGKSDRIDYVSPSTFTAVPAVVPRAETAQGVTPKNAFEGAGPTTFKDVVRAANAPGLAAQERVGQRPQEEEDQNIDIAVLMDQGGVLTPKGTLVLDPQIEYTHSSVNRFFFDGVEIVGAVLFGLFEAREIDRDTVTASAGLRYGLTNRLELSSRISWLYRDDRIVSQDVELDTGNGNIFESSGKGAGDLDFGLNYQINKPKGGAPFYVANLRVKTDTGDGPFDVQRDLATGLETELPTGSGFWTIEPSLTIIYPTDPAVLFMNIGYQYTIEETIDQIVRDRTIPINTDPDDGIPTALERTVISIGDVDPGDAFSVSMGLGIGLNDSVSLSFGYEHTWALSTETEQVVARYEDGILDTTDRFLSESNDAQVGSLLIGASINLDNNTGFSVNVATGVTDDSPDIRVSLRAPFSYTLFSRR